MNTNTLDRSIMATVPQLHLPIPPESPRQFWQNAATAYTTAGSRWQASLDRACLEAILPWLQDRDPSARIWTNSASQPSFWEVVNGSAIDFQHSRLVLIPTTALDFAELRVPQEWVDLPSWAGDYYVSIYVDPDESEIQVLGYTTHLKLKQQGQYDPLDRTYSLDTEDLVPDLNVLWLARQLCPTEILKAPLTPLPQMSLAQATNLLDRLGDVNLLRPRLAIPFTLWGGLMEHGGWRQQLYQHRLGLPASGSVSEWFQAGVSRFAQQLGWNTLSMEPSLVLARGTHLSTTQTLLRPLTIAGSAYELRVFPKGHDLWRFELHSATSKPIPPGFKLRLLTEDLLPFANNEDLTLTEIDRLFLEVRLSPGDGLVWEIEPRPDSFDREILRF
jgi:Protein of unknown function (DUF1822)